MLEDAKAAGVSVGAITEAVKEGEAIKTEINGNEATDRVLVITAGSMSSKDTAQLEDDVPAKEPTSKGKEKKGVTATNDGKKTLTPQES